MAAGDEAPHDLTVLISKAAYDRAMLKSVIEIAALLTLLVFFAVGCCLFYTRCGTLSGSRTRAAARR